MSISNLCLYILASVRALLRTIKGPSTAESEIFDYPIRFLKTNDSKEHNNDELNYRKSDEFVINFIHTKIMYGN